MICSEFYKLLDNYELLDMAQRELLEDHAAECEKCRRELEFFKSIMDISASIPVPETPGTLINDVNARLDSETGRHISFRPDFRVLSTVAACLAIGLAVGINNGYIKKSIAPGSGDGVITETRVAEETAGIPETTEQATAAPVDEAAVDTDIVKPSEPAVTEKKPPQSTTTVTGAVYETSAPVKAVQTKPAKVISAPAVISTHKPAQTVQTKAPEVSVKPMPTETATKPPVVTEAPQTAEPDAPAVEDYEISENDEYDDYAYYKVRSTSARTTNAFSDYLYVGSADMGTVVSTMSEMGIKNSNGYYMSSRDDFNALIDTLSDKGVGYECDLKYNSGDNIAFVLTYD